MSRAADTAGEASGLVVMVVSAAWIWLGDNTQPIAALTCILGFGVNWYYAHRRAHK